MSDMYDSLNLFDENKSYSIFEPIQSNTELFTAENELKPRIFKINDYKFLKKKREETLIKSKNRKQWTEEQDGILTNLATNYPQFSWQQISTFFKDRSAIQCMHRWKKVLQPFLRKGKWTQDEDKILLNWVDKNGPNKWAKLSLILKGRSSKQIRDRWINNLNPQKSKQFEWTEELDKFLLLKYLEYGSSWVSISKYLPHTSENMIKNRFYSMLRSIANKIRKKNHVKDLGSKLKDNKKQSTKHDELEKFWIFDDEENDEEKEIKVKKYKRNNFSLSYLLNFLPNLLEEKGVYPSKLDSDEKNPFFEKLEVPVVHTKSNSETIIGDKKIEATNKIVNTLNKFKSTILLNLQLQFLNRIFQRLKLQIIQNYFDCFKENTIL